MKFDIEAANRILANPRLNEADALNAAVSAIGVDELVSADDLEPDEAEPRTVS